MIKMKARPYRSRRGFILLEVVLSMTFFGIAAVGFMVALKKVGDLAELATERTTITRIIDSALVDALSRPQLEVGEDVIELQEFGPEARLQVKTIISELELENKDEAILQEMFRIQIELEWYDGSEWQERTGETWRFGRMYQP